MGNNFYIWPKGEMEDDIHIGKSHHRLRFQFQSNIGLSSWLMIKEAIKKPANALVDESGESWVVDEFIKMVEASKRHPVQDVHEEDGYVDEDGFVFYYGDFS